MSRDFEPLILGFCCNWCSYAAADTAGTARIQYPANLRIIRVMCSGMVHPNLVVEALTRGADGVLICGCRLNECHYVNGNLMAERRAEAIRLLLDDLGIDQARFRIEWLSGSEAERFAGIVKQMVEDVKMLGPNPLKKVIQNEKDRAGK